MSRSPSSPGITFPAVAVADTAPASVTVLPAALPRRVAVVILPRAGESFASWMDRFAAEHQIPPGTAATLLGLEIRGYHTSDVRPVFYGLALSQTTRRRLAAATGLEAEVLDDMQLARYDGTALDLTGLDLNSEASLRRLLKREWFLPHGSRACPRCLAEAPVWPTWWRLGIAAVCPVHRVLLLDTCPSCGIPLRRGYAGHPRGLSRAVVAAPDVCGNHVGPGRCAQPMGTMPAVPVEEHLVAAQQAALRAADGWPVPIAGEPVEPTQWFQAVKYLAGMIRFTGAVVRLPRRAEASTRAWMRTFACEYQQRREAGKVVPGSLRAIPAGAEHAAGLLAAAHHVLAAPDRRTCAQGIAPLVEAMTATRRRTGGHNPLRHVRAPEPLATILDRLAPPSSRVAGTVPVLADRGEVELRHVPQQLDRTDYRELIARHLPGTAEPSGRRLAALAMARLVGATSWVDAGRQLDMSQRKAARASDAVLRRISDVPAFWNAITQAARRLRRRPLVDFAARRTALANLVEVPAEVLATGCRPLGFPVTPQRRRHAAAWVWAEFTCADVRDAPAYAAEWPSATPESIREGARRFDTWLPAPVEADLRRWATALLNGEEAR
ncbi:TniQ family protein [Saccharothrix lopnurensis]|uniref:TniQ family protein n=1 Tax=Saccharothrix lopnurensis TaxID=1670621 RepID=A0ABW1NZ66_9PSEU